MRILLLGGTGEARSLAARLHPGHDIVSSLAGRVPDPALPAGPVRIGGFGGVAGLRQWLSDNDIGAVVDATHPFASTMTAHAAQVCRELGLPHLVLSRPAWDPVGTVTVASDVAAAAFVAERGFTRVFLTTGRSGVRPFADSDAWFLIRVVTPPDADVLPRRHEVLLSRGPYGYEDEHTLLRDNGIDVLVTKNSGGLAPKLEAARSLALPVIIVDRPPVADAAPVVSTVDEALAWLGAIVK